jgi:acetyl-CoA carboxylase carboxyltransferase component
MTPEAALRTHYKSRVDAAAQPEAEAQKVLRELEALAGPFQAAMNGAVDDIVEPQEVRQYLVTCLETLRGQRGDFIGRHLMQIWPTGF